MTHVLDALGRIKEYWGTVALADLAGYARGVIIRGGAVDYEAYDASLDGAVLIGDGTDIISDRTPTIWGLVTGASGFLATGYTLVGAPAANDYMVFGMDSPTGRIFAYDPVGAAYLALLSDVDIYRLRYTSGDTNVLHYLLRLEVFTTNVAAAGLGNGIEFQIEDDGGGFDVLGTIECITTDPTAGAEHGAMIIRTADIGDDGLAVRWTWDHDGKVTANVDGADVAYLHAEGWMGDTFAFPAKNTSGGAVTANSVGYLDEAGEFKLSSVDYEDVAWCVVIEGGANNADIYVARRGRVTIELTANCAVGDFLYMANSVGNQHRARPETYMRAEMFAIARTANVGGAGGTCSALLYCHTKFVAQKDPIYLYGIVGADVSNFRAQISGVAGAVVTWNAVGVGGSGNTIDPFANNLHMKVRLYNETDADYALIDDVNVGARQITLTAAVPVGWAIGEWITARSQTCVVVGAPYFFDLDLSSADNTIVPELARSIFTQLYFRDTGAVTLAQLHPWHAHGVGTEVAVYCQVANVWKTEHIPVPLYQRRLCHRFNASGAATASLFLFLAGWWEAAP